MNDDQIDDLKQFIDSKISQSEARLHSEVADMRIELKKEISDTRGELKEEIAQLREETREGFKGVAVAFEELNLQQEELHAADKRQETLIAKLRKSTA